LDVVVRERASILQLLAGKDQTLLVWGNTLLVLDLGLNIVNSIGGLDLKSDGLAREGLDEAVVQLLALKDGHHSRNRGLGGKTYICTVSAGKVSKSFTWGRISQRVER
jgi:hypothetical protein